MTPDRATPPNAAQAAPAADRSRPPPPVRRACLLILASLAIGVILLWPGVRPNPPGEEAAPALFTLAALVVFGGLTLWLAARLYQGRNWARWAMLGYLMLGWWFTSSELNNQFLQAPIVGFMDLVCIAMEGLACWLLFTGAGARWFADLGVQARGRRAG